MDVTLPSGITIKGIPDGTSKDDIMKKAISSGQAEAGDFEENDYEFSKMVRNVPGSAVQFAKDVTAPIHSPKQTYDALSSLVRGGYSKITGGESPDEATVDAVVEMYKKRYGTIDRAQRTLQDDPVGMLSDMTSIFSGGAIGGSKVAGSLGAKTAANVLDKAGRIAMATDPVNVGINTAKAGIKPLIGKNTANNMLQSAMKFSTAKFDAAERKQLADTMLKYDINPTEKGMDKASDIVKQKASDIGNVIDDMTAEGQWGDLTNVDKNVGQYRSKIADPLANTDMVPDVAELDGLFNPWRDEVANAGDLLTPRKLQDLKTDQYEKINWNQSQNRGSQVRQDFRKNVARGAKETLEELEPSLKYMNKDLGALLALTRGKGAGQGPLTQSTNRIMNRDISGIGVPIKMAAMESIFPGAGAAIGGLWGYMDTPTRKAKNAMSLNKIKTSTLPQNYMNNSLMGLLGRQAIEELGMAQEYLNE